MQVEMSWITAGCFCIFKSAHKKIAVPLAPDGNHISGIS